MLQSFAVSILFFAISTCVVVISALRLLQHYFMGAQNVTETKLSDSLRELAQADTRPAAARLRDVLDDVEAALAAGVRRADIVQKLNDAGITITLRGFDSALYRARKMREKKTPTAPYNSAAAPPAPAPQAAPKPSAAPVQKPAQTAPRQTPEPAQAKAQEPKQENESGSDASRMVTRLRDTNYDPLREDD